MLRTRPVRLACLLTLGLAATLIASPPSRAMATGPTHIAAPTSDPGQPSGQSVPADFNGDGFSDLAISSFFEGVGSASITGAINVIWGTASGLSAANNQFLDMAAATGIDDVFEAGFGNAMASGDFNADGFADLAIGAPGTSPVGGMERGMVVVMYGSAAGLTSTGSQIWESLAAADLAGTGESVATGDLNGDGYSDLIAGSPWSVRGQSERVGHIDVVYGSAQGLVASGRQVWVEDSPDVAGHAKAYDYFGSSLSAGDVDGDGYDEIAVSVYGKTVGRNNFAGGVIILPGSAAGTTGLGSALWTQDSDGISEKSELGELMGLHVALGDVTGDGFADLVAAVPFEDVGTVDRAGGANLILGGPDGLTSVGDTFWSQDHAGVTNTAEVNDRFASGLALGDFNSDGRLDAAFGVPGEDLAAVDQGAVNVLLGAPGGLTTVGQHLWTQDSTGILDKGELGDSFGNAVSVGQFGNGAQDDLAVGAPLESVGTVFEAGAVNVLNGGTSGLSSTGNQFWNQDTPGILDAAETSDWFGFVLDNTVQVWAN